MGAMRHLSLRALPLVLAALAFAASGARASSLDPGPSLGYVPRVPISALARPISAIDPSRFHVSTMVSVGSGSGWGAGTQALQVTSLSYQFKAPIEMRVSVGNAWGSQAQGGSSFFLEGADLTFRPNANSFLQISYQNVRSPLQYNSSPFYAPYWAR
jgi:hypothetical protein